MHASGVHATVAGVLLGFTVPVIRSRAAGGPDAGPGLAEHFEHRIRPLSAGFAVPVFAFFAAGVEIGGLHGLGDSLTDPIALGIVLGLVVGKPLGIVGTTWLAARFTRASLDDELSWLDVVGLGLLAGIGFTVSLLIGDLAFGGGGDTDDHVKVGILLGLAGRRRRSPASWSRPGTGSTGASEAENVDDDQDGIPDVYQR